MKDKIIMMLILSVLLLSSECIIMAQGIIIYKNDGSQIKIPYAEMDSIVTNPCNLDAKTGISLDRNVDLGLSVNWAGYNVGATKPSDPGKYYAWGETLDKISYTALTYKYCLPEDEYTASYENIGSNISGTKYDAVTYNWGDDWRMPTEKECRELIENCTWTWTTFIGINGYKITGPNGSSIFLPAAGGYLIPGISGYDSACYYFSGSSAAVADGVECNAYGIYATNNGQYDIKFARCYGLSMRGVTEKKEQQNVIVYKKDSTSIVIPYAELDSIVTFRLSEEIELPIVQEVDLGLSVTWAGWNIGASSPEEFGGYYAWGETEEKEVYTYETYVHWIDINGDGRMDSTRYIGDSICGTIYDVATQKWGNGWRMPTNEEFNELKNNCVRNRIIYNGVDGWLYKGPNGNSIFFPLAGFKKSVYIPETETGIPSFYWTGSLMGDNDHAFVCYVGVSWGGGSRRPYGAPVRAVRDKKMSIDIFAELENDELVFVEGGTFMMGAQANDPSAPNYDSTASSDESPVHEVTLDDYYIGKYEVTQQLWEYVMSYSGTVADGTTMSAYASDVWLGTNPSSSYGVGDYYPAYYVSYYDVVNIFIPRLNKMTGKTFRLPTEAEWEYAARGGNKSQGYKYSGSNTVGDVAWYPGHSSSTTHPVGIKQPNELGLYDMSGNVREWCGDQYGTYLLTPQINPIGASGMYGNNRGGDWCLYTNLCRVSARSCFRPDYRSYSHGFRLALRP